MTPINSGLTSHLPSGTKLDAEAVRILRKSGMTRDLENVEQMRERLKSLDFFAFMRMKSWQRISLPMDIYVKIANGEITINPNWMATFDLEGACILMESTNEQAIRRLQLLLKLTRGKADGNLFNGDIFAMHARVTHASVESAILGKVHCWGFVEERAIFARFEAKQDARKLGGKLLENGSHAQVAPIGNNPVTSKVALYGDNLPTIQPVKFGNRESKPSFYAPTKKSGIVTKHWREVDPAKYLEAINELDRQQKLKQAEARERELREAFN